MSVKELGRLIREYTYDGSTFYVRGLTVGEFCDLAMQGLLKDSERFWVEIALTGVVGWEDIFVEDEDGGHQELEFSEDGKQGLPIEVLVYLGKKIYNELTILSDDESKKFEAATRFLHFCSGDKNKSVAETFDCETCLRKGLARLRPCGRFTKEEIEQYMGELQGEGEETPQKASQKPVKNMKSKYKSKRTKMAFENEEVKPKPKKVDTIVLDKYSYPECPVSYIDSWINILCGILYHCAKSNIPFFDGGIVDQPYKYYRAERVVSSESSVIESEEMERARKEAERGSKKRR